MTGVKETQNTYLSSFERFEKNLAGGGQSWLHEIRRAAIQRFAELGFPSTHIEEWKYTNVAPLTKIDFEPASNDVGRVSAEDIARSPLVEPGSIRLVFVDGRFSEELSSLEELPRGITARSLAQELQYPDRKGGGNATLEAHLSRYADYNEHAFAALNTAFIEDGAFIEIQKGIRVERPIHLLFVSTASDRARVSHPRSLIVAGRESQAVIIEEYMGPDGAVYFTNAVTEIVAGESAIIEHYKVQQESDDAFHIATLQVEQERSSNFVSHSISLGGALTRNDFNSVLDGEGAECMLNGLYATDGRQFIDNHTLIDHASPHCTSRELYKGILDGKSEAVFNGAVIVRKDAQKSDARQSNKNLLLSKDATINTKPQLEIFADDVKCAHGATIGQVDREAIFYLRSRGIAEETAHLMLTAAFAQDILNRMKAETIRARIEEVLSARLSFKEVL
ncbi:MAG: Fe-S cluster assembly protein SufD [Blastocatellia bacterium]|nr:Fe-S cluster assembly protein SufD [Blastocatellia bacterium]